MIENKNIDSGKGFDWGRTSSDYAKYRDIYPNEFYRYILECGICKNGHTVLDIGTGTGVLPRNLYKHGAKFTGIDISENQIGQASILAKESGMDINFLCSSAEDISFDENTFDAVTACQCFAYFEHETLAPIIRRILKPGGIFAVFYMEWLPFEDKIAGMSEDLVLKYNPKWSGGGETRHYLNIPEAYDKYFTTMKRDIFDVRVPFTRETWNGRMKACRGIGASLPDSEVAKFEREHIELLEKNAPETFDILHFVTAVILQKRDATDN